MIDFLYCKLVLIPYNCTLVEWENSAISTNAMRTMSFSSTIIKACLTEMEVEKAQRCTITVLQTCPGKKRLKSNNYDIYHFIPNVWIRPAPVIACGRQLLINKRTTLEIPKAMCDSHRDTCLISIMGYLSTDVPQILVPVDFFAYDNKTWGW